MGPGTRTNNREANKMYRKAHIENGRITWTREVTGEDIFLAVAVLSSISSIYLLFWS